MPWYELLLLAAGLAMDAVAVSLCDGISYNLSKRQKLLIPLAFGAAQALMPLAGLAIGNAFFNVISSLDHWVAFALLVFLGVKMIIDSKKGEQSCGAKLSARVLLSQALATSIDALAVGIGFGLMGIDPLSTSLVIGAVTFALCLPAVFLGRRASLGLGRYAKLAGGILLTLLGLKILIEHLF